MASYLINFYPVDADSVESGVRRQVTRQHRNDGKRIRVGDNLQLYVRLRTAYGRLMKEVRCAEVLNIRLDIASGELIVDGRKADADELQDIAVREGFVDAWHMRYELGKTHPQQFDGYVARW